MCGIVGFTIARDESRDHHAIAGSMLASITHRGPDDQAIRLADKIVLGHNRLTIMEPSGGQQPRVNDSNGDTLIYNGEIYNHRSFDAGIQAAGGQLRDHCDTETLFWLLRQHGTGKTVSMIDGMFAFAWYEAGSDTLYLARDRFGQKPLFYAEAGGELIFASEIKALRCHPALANAAPDFDALRLFLMMEYIPGTATGIEGIKELPPGHLLKRCAGSVTIESYWQAGRIDRDDSIDEPSAVITLDAQLSKAVNAQLVADVPVGVFLSGGLDSSLIAAMAKKHKNDVATFTVKFPYASFDESSQAAAVAAHLGTRHTTVELGRQNCIDGIEKLLTYMDQPLADSSFLPSYLLCQATKQYVTVALGGDGADELFLGYPNFRVLKAAKVMSILPAIVGSGLRALTRLLPGSGGYMNRTFLLRQLSYGFGKPPGQQSMHWMAAIPPFEQASLWSNTTNVEAGLIAALETQVDASSAVPLLEQCQQQFINAYLAHDILLKMDRAAMYSSLEVRSPFLTAAIADVALSLPISLMFDGSRGKQVLRKVANAYLPEQTITQKKHGFALPVSALLRGDLRDIAQAMLVDTANPMYAAIEFDVVNGWWTQHMSGKRDHGKALWSLLVLAAYCRNQF